MSKPPLQTPAIIEAPLADGAEDRAIETAVQRWIAEAVVGLNLCPFAAPVVEGDQIHIHVSPAQTYDDAIRDALGQAAELLDMPAETRATTLVVFPNVFKDFLDFLDAAEDFTDLLSVAGGDGLLQVPTFHPDYQFEGEAPDSLGSYTNRAVWPIFHLLRERDVMEALARHPDPEQIPADNIARLDALGETALRTLWARFAATHKAPEAS